MTSGKVVKFCILAAVSCAFCLYSAHMYIHTSSECRMAFRWNGVAGCFQIFEVARIYVDHWWASNMLLYSNVHTYICIFLWMYVMHESREVNELLLFLFQCCPHVFSFHIFCRFCLCSWFFYCDCSVGCSCLVVPFSFTTFHAMLWAVLECVRCFGPMLRDSNLMTTNCFRRYVMHIYE